ncbi:MULTISPECIES: type VI secretion system tip protein TssI/VgrG [unclassified Bartonella]|uniref:type VI secretion system tip protein TssI/VgrG n=1 Tax=unclassified Bartonella TaxID=2645622 RepID=UPI00290568B5|nr:MULTISPECIES: type VI secretion system tip protein TssI/VgrG [unclassified Bartonella]
MSAMPILPKQFQDQDIAFSYWMKEAPNDTFVVTAFAVDEAIFGMTKIEVMLSSSDDNIDLQALLDSAGTLTVHHKYMETLRHFSGVVVEAERGDRGHHRTAYRLVLMPSLYRLDHGSDCRVFQTKKVGDIVKELFSEHGIENVTWDIDEGSHDAREYCVQYRESHLGFVERILAEEGIFYYFEHDKEGILKLIISDKPNVLHDCPGLKEIEYNSLSSGSVKGLFCSSLSYREKLRATTVVQRDYTFKNPVYNQEHKEKTANPNGEKHDYELYDYPGRYKKDSAGKAFTRYKLEATRVDASLGYGVSNAPHLLTGHGITLFEHPDDRLNQKWRLLTIRHEGVQPQAWGEDAQGASMADTGIVAPGLHGTMLSGLSFGTTSSHSPNLLTQSLNRRMGLAIAGNNNGSDNATVYANAFAVQPSHLPYRAPQTVKPLIDGPQIATVVGPEGEEIHTDQYGRVKVHFPWDRHKDPKAEDSSCWIRVASNWAGAKWAHIAIPRIGQEVIVDFLEGDPDQPIVTGRTYNAQNMPPYALPENKTRMTIKSQTHKGDGFNELRFEDEKDQEEIFIHAQKDMGVRIKNNLVENISGSNIRKIDKDEIKHISKDYSAYVAGSYNIIIGYGNSKKSTTDLLDLREDNLQRPDFLDNDKFFEGSNNSFSILTQGSINFSSDSSFKLMSKNNMTINSKGNIDTASAGSITSSSKIDCNLKAGQNITISADKTFKIELARSHFLMTNDGRIRIKAQDLEFDIGNRIILLSELEFIIKSAKVNIN